MNYGYTAFCAALLFSSSVFASQTYTCDRVYFSDKGFLRASADFAEKLMPETLKFMINRDKEIATVSVTGMEILTLKRNSAYLTIRDSPVQGHRLQLDFRKLEKNGEVTWGPHHSDDNYKKVTPSRYTCKPD